jgi:hypothetical protein
LSLEQISGLGKLVFFPASLVAISCKTGSEFLWRVRFSSCCSYSLEILDCTSSTLKVCPIVYRKHRVRLAISVTELCQYGDWKFWKSKFQLACLRISAADVIAICLSKHVPVWVDSTTNIVAPTNCYVFSNRQYNKHQIYTMIQQKLY